MLQREFFAFEADTKYGHSSYIAVNSPGKVGQSCPIYDLKLRGGIRGTAPLIPDLGTKG